MIEKNRFYSMSRKTSIFVAMTVAIACCLCAATPAHGAAKLCEVQAIEKVGGFLGSDSDPNKSGEYVCGMSADGRYILIVSIGTISYEKGIERASLYITDMKTGTERAIWEDGNMADPQGWIDTGDSPISASGRYVVFSSNKAYLVKGDTNRKSDIFLYDGNAGTLKRISVNAKGKQGNGHSDKPVISGNGRYVYYTSSATNLAPGGKKKHPGFYRYDIKKETTARLPISEKMVRQEPGFDYRTIDRKNAISGVSYSGRYIAFVGRKSSGPYSGPYSAYRYDTRKARLLRLKKPSAKGYYAGMNNGGAWEPMLSGDGNRVSFLAENNKGDDTSSAVFIQECKTGKSAMANSFNPTGYDDWFSYRHALSQNGRYVAYNFWHDKNRSNNDNTVAMDIFLYDRVKGKRQLVKRFYCTDPYLYDDGTDHRVANNLYISKNGRHIGVTVWSRDGYREASYRITLKFNS
jgi:Tol biopolymer transport system component